EALVSVSIFIGALANIAVTATLFTHRWRERGLAAEAGTPPVGRGEVFRAPFYPLLPLVMVTLWTAFAVNVLVYRGWRVGYGLIATLLASGAYLWRERRRRPRE